MSKSIHQTIKNVFGDKSRAEIEDMIDNNHPDVVALRKKREFKQQVRNDRALKKILGVAPADST